METYLDLFQDFVSRRGNGLPHFLSTGNFDLKNFPCQFMYQIGKDNSTCGFTCFITSLSSVLSTVLTGRSLEPIQMAISCSAFSCFSSVHCRDLPLNYFLINIHMYFNIYQIITYLPFRVALSCRRSRRRCTFNGSQPQNLCNWGSLLGIC